MKVNISIPLINIAQELDTVGMYREADMLTDLAQRQVLAQYAGPQNLNIPLENRVIPFGEMAEEYEDVARKRRQYNPRLTPKEREQDPIGDINDIYGPEGETEEDRHHHHKHHHKHHNHHDEYSTENDNTETDDTIFNINHDQQNEGGSVFSLNGESTGGITQRVYDPKGAGYMGLDNFKWENRDSLKKGYPTYSPN